MLTDRYLLANVVYQGHAGGLDVATLWEVGRAATGGLMPELTIVLDLPVAAAAGADAASAGSHGTPGRVVPRAGAAGIPGRGRALPGTHRRARRRSGPSRPFRKRSATKSERCFPPPTPRRGFFPDPRPWPLLMSWHGILGHDVVVERFRRALRRGRLGEQFPLRGAGRDRQTDVRPQAGAGLAVPGPARGGASIRAKSARPAVQVAAAEHPDFETVAKPDDKSFIPVELLIGDKEHRMRRRAVPQSVAAAEIRRRAEDRGGGRRRFLQRRRGQLPAEDAGRTAAAVGADPDRHQPRAAVADDPLPLPVDSLRSLAGGDCRRAARCPGHRRRCGPGPAGGQASEGSLRRAEELADADLAAFRNTLLDRLADPRFDPLELSKLMVEFVDQAGREAPLRRRRLRQIVGLAATFYRQLLRMLADGSASADAEVLQAIERWQAGPAAAAACLDRCLETAEQIDRNANQATLIECWLDDLAQAGSAA